jgi:kumamolisin
MPERCRRDCYTCGWSGCRPVSMLETDTIIHECSPPKVWPSHSPVTANQAEERIIDRHVVYRIPEEALKHLVWAAVVISPGIALVRLWRHAGAATAPHPAPLPLPPIDGLPPAAAGLQSNGQLTLDIQVPLTIGLLTNRQALENDLAAIYDPNSPQYGHYLTPQEIAARYGASQATIDHVTAYLQDQGFQILEVSPLRDSISVSATVGQIERTFGILLQTFQQQGTTVYGPNGTATLPPTLQSLVTSVIGLSSFAQPRHTLRQGAASAVSTPEQQNADCSGAQSTGITMSQVAAAYSYAKAYKVGYTGKGISVGILEFNDHMNMNDLTTFLTCTVGGTLHYSLVKVDGGSQISSDGANGEAEMDFEYLGALAPDAQLIEYQTSCTNCGDNTGGVTFAKGFADLLNRIAADDKVQVVSTSWGGDEGAYTQDEIFSMDQAIKRLAAEGIAFLASAGDCAAFDDGQYGDLSVDFPAADPYTVSVGGTLLQTDANGNRLAEPAWDTYPKAPDKQICQYNDWGTGGGLSTLFKQPPWQKGPGVTNPYSNGHRQIPDVTAIAWDIAEYMQGKWDYGGGTSAATPIWAAGIALIDQGLRQHHKHLIGAVPTFYQVASRQGKYHPYYDVTRGDNLSYPATPGYDLSSGWGAPNLLDFGKVLGAF